MRNPFAFRGSMTCPIVFYPGPSLLIQIACPSLEVLIPTEGTLRRGQALALSSCPQLARFPLSLPSGSYYVTREASTQASLFVEFSYPEGKTTAEGFVPVESKKPRDSLPSRGNFIWDLDVRVAYQETVC